MADNKELKKDALCQLFKDPIRTAKIKLKYIFLQELVWFLLIKNERN